MRVILLLTTLLMSHGVVNGIYAKEALTSDPHKITKETRNISNFDTVAIAGYADVYIKQGNKEELKIEAESGLIPFISSEVDNNQLLLELKDNAPTQNKPIRYYLVVKNIKDILMSGSVSTVIQDKFEGPEINLAIKGAGAADIKVNVKKLTTKIAGNGVVRAEGNAEEQSIAISGTGGFDGNKLLGKTADVKIRGKGVVTVNTTDNLDVKIIGGGKVQYHGKPKTSELTVGGGEVISIEGVKS